MNRIKLIACDMDGTLLTDDKRINEADRKAICKLRDAGIVFMIATGRHDAMVRHYLRELGLDSPVISCNGAVFRNLSAPRL